MTTYFIPAVVPVAYPALQQLCDGRLPETFEAWSIGENAARRILVAEGHHVIGVCVTPGELDRYCRSRRCPADAAALAALTARRGAEILGSEAEYRSYRDSIVVTEDVRAVRPEIVEAEDAPIVRRPWWALWRPKYETVAAGTLRPEVAPRRHRWWAFWRRDEVVLADRRQPPPTARRSLG